MSQLVVATSRILLLLLAGGAVVAAYLVEKPGAREATAARYACPMHPQAVATGPGTCPICGMQLVAADAEAPDDPAGDHVVPMASEITVAQRRRFDDAIVAPAWVERNGDIAGLLYEEDVAVLADGERGSFEPAARRLQELAVERRADRLPASWDSSTSRVTFRAVAPADALVAGTVGRLVFSPRAREALVVPSAAVLEGAEGTYVLAALPGAQTFARRPVEVGKVVRGFAVVVSGLSDQERVVVRDAFFLDVEHRLHASAD